MTMADPRSQSELNTWLVEEMYEQYRQDPSQLTASWRDFFADYRPGDSGPTAERAANGGSGGGGGPVRVPSDIPIPDTIDVEQATRLRGVGARIVENMETSLTVPTATSVRDMSRRSCWKSTAGSSTTTCGARTAGRCRSPT
jgi:multifunctional 2-oxoglutarate metabolism enzyme